MASHYRNLLDDPLETGSVSDKPPIPSAIPISGDESSPLPTIPMVVLSIAVLGEFLSANVSTPFIVDMTKTFELGETSNLGSYTGAIISSFFITQFLTSLLWATIASKHGNRAVLFTALLGNALTCALFGTCTTFTQAVAVRLLQGVFNGAVGVARSTVTAVADPSNESRAYGIMGFSWGLGGVAGAIIGGSFESPAKNWPTTFGKIPLFVHYPYLLPTIIAASILLLGAILSLFLDWDGGPRRGTIRLPIEKPADEERGEGIDQEPTHHIDLGESPLREEPAPSLGVLIAKKKVSGYFARRVREAYSQNSPAAELPSPGSSRRPSNPILGAPINPISRNRLASASRGNRMSGSAYGYRPRNFSQSTITTARRRGSAATQDNRQRRNSTRPGAEDPPAPVEELSLAQRLLIANENAATSLPSLWVAAAINADNEDPFLDSEDDDDDEYDEAPDAVMGRLRSQSPPHRRPSDSPRRHREDSIAASSVMGWGNRRPSNSQAAAGRITSFSYHTFEDGAESARRPSISQHALPAIYANTGVSTPPALLDALGISPATTPTREIDDPFVDTLTPIVEGQVSQPDPVVAEATSAAPAKNDGLPWTSLPLFIIFQYFVLALHTTSHDQVFLMYLTSSYRTGGLGLDPSHFATLIALMCIAQVIYQFYLYPNIGPPRGKFSHLAMFRIGSTLFIPAYLSVTFYRVFASSSDDGNVFVMTLLTISTAIRYAGSTFAFTSIAVLLNYLSPPHLVAFSNGLAQSLASLARVIGPLLGGWLWAESTNAGPDGFPYGFYAVSTLCAAAIGLTFFIR
ncbi:major facilitator superfamily MFS-1 [Clavulina sp. PMI_390]|nr:major facilitator superfamily MFS-1 [Clavulina sp. PMI_390]